MSDLTVPRPRTWRERLQRARRRWRRLIWSRRRLLTATSLGVAVALGLSAIRPPEAPHVDVSVAARDLPAGAILTGSDIASQRYPREAVPSGLVAAPIGERLAAPMRRGEAFTDARMLGPSAHDGYPGRVTLPVRLPDAGAAALLRVGDRIDLVATDPQSGDYRTVAAGALVVSLPQLVGAGGAVSDGGSMAGGSIAGGSMAGALIVIAVTPDEVGGTLAGSVREYLSIAWER